MTLLKDVLGLKIGWGLLHSHVSSHPENILITIIIICTKISNAKSHVHFPSKTCFVFHVNYFK